MTLPEEFQEYTRAMMGPERYATFFEALQQEPLTSIRLNPAKAQPMHQQPVPWCRYGYYLSGRPNFTFDPLFHAGLYYVQEASSMFLDLVLQQHLPDVGSISFLDLCAAPGGKSTLIYSALPEGSTLVCNEPNRQRAQVLSENMQKWLLPTLSAPSREVGRGLLVTNNLPADFRRAGLIFDAILCDVPCSGEGMFRKDPATIGEWSPANVEKCARLQREIVADAWQCLAPGGLFIYSTCTLNTHENEENILWMMDEMQAQPLTVDIKPEWNITGSLFSALTAPVYRFIPGFTQGEGLFMAVMKKRGERREERGERIPIIERERECKKQEKSLSSLLSPLSSIFIQEIKDAHAPIVDITYQQAIAYLRREAITLPPETPRGIVVVAYQGNPLGLAKNVGNRANNLYPKPWRILSTHIPDEPFTIYN